MRPSRSSGSKAASPTCRSIRRPRPEGMVDKIKKPSSERRLLSGGLGTIDRRALVAFLL